MTATRINTLKARREAINAELSKFAPHSKAARAVELREELGKVEFRIKAYETKMAKETVVDNASGEVKTDEKVSALHRLQEAMENFTAACGVTGTKRKIVAWVIGAVASFTTGYLIGKVAELLILAALSATSSMFLAVLIYVLALIVAMYAGVKVGNRAYHYIANGTIDQHWADAKSAVTGFFKPKLVAA